MKTPTIGRLLELPENKDERGCLCFAEAGRLIPFEIKRTFWVYNTPSQVRRGNHAHKKSRQAHVCLHGSAEITLDNGSVKEELILNKPNMVLILGPMVWHSFVLKKNSLLYVFTSDWYDPTDYIRDYGEFLSLVKNPPCV